MLHLQASLKLLSGCSLLLARLLLSEFLSEILLVSTSLLQDLVHRLLFFRICDLACLDAEGLLRNGDDLLEGVLGNILEFRPRRVAFLYALLARLLWEDQQ